MGCTSKGKIKGLERKEVRYEAIVCQTQTSRKISKGKERKGRGGEESESERVGREEMGETVQKAERGFSVSGPDHGFRELQHSQSSSAPERFTSLFRFLFHLIHLFTTYSNISAWWGCCQFLPSPETLDSAALLALHLQGRICFDHASPFIG